MKYRYTKIHRRPARRARSRRSGRRSCPTCCCRADSATRTAIDDDERTMQALHDAILDALFNGGVLPEETIERLLGDPADGDQEDAALEARRADSADHRAHGRAGLHLDAARSRSRARAARRSGRGAARQPTGARSKSPTRRSTSSATARCAICSDHSARAASAATTRASRRPASRRPARPSRTSSATRSTSTPRPRC